MLEESLFKVECVFLRLLSSLRISGKADEVIYGVSQVFKRFFINRVSKSMNKCRIFSSSFKLVRLDEVSSSFNKIRKEFVLLLTVLHCFLIATSFRKGRENPRQLASLVHVDSVLVDQNDVANNFSSSA